MSYPVFQVPAGDVLPVMFSSYAGATGASVTLTGLAVTDIEIYKDGSVTQRASDAGYVLLDTDGIDFDAITGIHGFSIDTGDNTDAGFYTVGAWFTVVVSAVTVDSQTVNFIACQFRLMPAESVAGMPKIDLASMRGVEQSAIDLTDFADAGYDPATNKVQGVVLVDTITTYTGNTPQTGDNFARLGAPAGASVSADVAAVKADSAAIKVKTDFTPSVTSGAAGGLFIAGTNAATTVTTSLTTTFTGNLTGSVGSVTGAVGSVTGAVGSVTGNVGGNVAGSVGSVTGAVGSVTGAVGSVTGAVGSVTGNVGGNVVGSVGSVTARVTANTDQIAGVATGATRLARSTQGIVTGTVGAASTTTSIVTSALDPAAAVIDQYKGRIVTFDQGTTTTNLKGQSTDITGNTALGVLTVTALTTAPVSGDTFTIT